MPDPASRLLVLYGGTFDPVHCGHLAVATAAHARLGATVHLLPATDPPHRPPTGAGAAQRAAMLSLAVEGRTGLAVDTRELERGVPSRTIDTLQALRAEHGDDLPIAFVLGADSFRALPTWKGWPHLLDAAHWVVAGREGHPLEADLPAELADAVHGRRVEDPDRLRAGRGGCVLPLHQPLHPVSASRIRALVAAGAPWRHLVPDAVAAFIDHHRLYMAPGAASAPDVPPL